MGGGPASAVSPMIAHQSWASGLRARGGVRTSLRMGLWAIVLTSAPMMLHAVVGRPILLGRWVRSRTLAADAGRFVGMLSFGLPFSLGTMVLRNFANTLGQAARGSCG